MILEWNVWGANLRIGTASAACYFFSDGVDISAKSEFGSPQRSIQQEDSTRPRVDAERSSAKTLPFVSKWCVAHKGLIIVSFEYDEGFRCASHPRYDLSRLRRFLCQAATASSGYRPPKTSFLFSLCSISLFKTGYKAEIMILRTRLVITTRNSVKAIIRVESELMVVIVPRRMVPST